jgi:hypothetical protein
VGSLQSDDYSTLPKDVNAAPEAKGRAEKELQGRMIILKGSIPLEWLTLNKQLLVEL